MQIKKKWKVSAFAVAVRSHKLGLLSDWQYHNLCVNMGRREMRTTEPDGIVPERSQIADKIMALISDSYSGPSTIEVETGIPYSLVRSLTFYTPVEAVKGGATRPRMATRTDCKTQIRNFKIIRSGK